MALQPDGKIVIAGSTDVGGDNELLIARLDALGGLDTTGFGVGGVGRIDPTSGDDAANQVFIEDDGSITVGGGANGTVDSVSSDQMTISTQAGGSRIVLLTPTTTVTQVSEATKAITDITAGQTVTVIGTANPDGSVTATSVVIGNVGGLFGGRGGFGGRGPAASSAP